MRRFALLLALLLAVPAAAFAPPPWTANANIYEVNIRQFTPEGTLAAFTKQLPRLKAMGVDTVWIMPVQPIGAAHRKGPLGSYYSIRDYTAVNPEFGTMADFKAMVDAAHGLGIKVVLDWVGNHTARDHPWIAAHPDWYQKDAQGRIGGYAYNATERWDDVSGLDYRAPALREAMIAAMKYWSDAGIDGFRADVAGKVPVDFWEAARTALDTPKPLFWLAEGDEARLTPVFDATYDWPLANLMIKVAHGKADAAALGRFIANPPPGFAPQSFKMNFTTNHDFNSWQGSDAKLYGAALKPMAVLAATLPGMPLIYGGQEGNLTQQLKFFERDPIAWKDYPLAGFYAGLLKLKAENPALANAPDSVITVLPTAKDVLAFERVRGGNRVTVAANLSPRPQPLRLAAFPGIATLPPWGYEIAVVK